MHHKELLNAEFIGKPPFTALVLMNSNICRFCQFTNVVFVVLHLWKVCM